jgi:arylsulfatase A-like enzyme
VTVGERSAFALVVLVSLAGPLVGQRLPEAERPEGAPLVHRGIEPVRGDISTAALPRVEIGSESRTVLWRTPRRVLRFEHPVDIDEDLPLELEVDLEREDFPVHVDGWVSIQPGEAAKSDLTGEAIRLRLPLRSLWLESPSLAATAAVTTTPPERVPSRRGLLTAVAWSLGRSSGRREAGPFEIERGDVLRFGFGIEEAAWAEGFAPARFTVSAVREDGSAMLLFERRLDPARDLRDRRWFDAVVPLEDFAGSTVGFAFEAAAIPVDGIGDPRSLPVFSNPEVRPEEPPRSARPNLVLISLDTLRAKSVGVYGNRRATTPTLDARVAGEGALVRQVVAPVPYTPPSHMTMLTGLEPCVHGIRKRGDHLAPEHHTLAEILRAAGYRTAAFTEDAYVVAAAGFARGFDTYSEERSDEKASPGFGVETFAKVESWLASSPPEPFFLFAHTYQVHAPYTPPRSYDAFFPDVVLEGKPALDELLRDYEREIRYTDDLLASTLNVLDTRGLSERTVLVVTSDHGETFGEALIGGHGFNLKDSELLVPLMIRAPGIVPAGTIVQEQVGLVDLAPTLLELLGLPGAEMQGRSFAALLGAKARRFDERSAWSTLELTFSDSVRTRDWKYLRAMSGELEDRLYDLGRDPEERHSIARERPDLVERARRELREHQERCGAWKLRHPTSQPLDDSLDHRPDWLVNRDEVTRKLQSLGYVEGPGETSPR